MKKVFGNWRCHGPIWILNTRMYQYACLYNIDISPSLRSSLSMISRPLHSSDPYYIRECGGRGGEHLFERGACFIIWPKGWALIHRRRLLEHGYFSRKYSSWLNCKWFNKEFHAHTGKLNPLKKLVSKLSSNVTIIDSKKKEEEVLTNLLTNVKFFS